MDGVASSDDERQEDPPVFRESEFQHSEWTFQGRDERFAWLIRRVRRHGVPPGQATVGARIIVGVFVGLAVCLVVAGIAGR